MSAKILYTRVSTLDQKTDRQRVNEKDYQLVIEDKCSGAIPFFDRQGGREVLLLLEKGAIGSLHVWSIDRLGRSLRDIVNTIHFFSERSIPIVFESQGLRTIDEGGKQNAITNLIISILGTVSEMGRTQIREMQMQGIKVAKLKGAYKGRKAGSVEDVHAFLDKPKNKKALEYLKKGYKLNEAAKLAGVHVNTITKIKRIGLQTI